MKISGRKITEFTVNHGPKTLTIPIKYDDGSDLFKAEFGGEVLSDVSVRGLKQQVRVLALQLLDTEWEKIVVVTWGDTTSSFDVRLRSVREFVFPGGETRWPRQGKAPDKVRRLYLPTEEEEGADTPWAKARKLEPRVDSLDASARRAEIPAGAGELEALRLWAEAKEVNRQARRVLQAEWNRKEEALAAHLDLAPDLVLAIRNVLAEEGELDELTS